MPSRSIVYDNARMDSLMVIVCVGHSCDTKRNYVVALKMYLLLIKGKRWKSQIYIFTTFTTH